MRKRAWVSVLMSGAAISLLWPGAAAADQTYRTQKYPVMPVGGAPPASGFVLNVHANGPVIYGQERYTLFGAEPSTSYQVTLTIYGDPECATPAVFNGEPLIFPTATLTTNAVGNGQAKGVFYAADVAPLVPQATRVPGVWTYSGPGSDGVAYTTGCQFIDLDVPPPPPPGRSRP